MTLTGPESGYPRTDLTAEEKTERLRYDDAPKHRGLPAIAERVHELFGVTVTTNYLRQATNSRRLSINLIGRKLYCSDRQLYDFIVLSTRQDGRSKAVRA